MLYNHCIYNKGFKKKSKRLFQLSFKPIMVDNYAAFFNCTPMGRVFNCTPMGRASVVVLNVISFDVEFCAGCTYVRFHNFS